MATSKLQQYTSNLFEKILSPVIIWENYHPKWLDGLELDFYIRDMSIAIEVQGRQHIEYIPYFHQVPSGLIEQHQRDIKKLQLCGLNNTTTLYIYSKEDAIRTSRLLLHIKRGIENSPEFKGWTPPPKTPAEIYYSLPLSNQYMHITDRFEKLEARYSAEGKTFKVMLEASNLLESIVQGKMRVADSHEKLFVELFDIES